MATLYIKNRGFRFPYMKWTDGETPSVTENLRHLEMHITDYMHEHTDDGETLWVVPKGFRFPYKNTMETLDKNMEYLEMQLEEFQHEHEIIGGSGNTLTPVRTITLSPSFSNFGPAYGDGFLWEADGSGNVYRVSISTGVATNVGTVPDSDSAEDGLTYHSGSVWTLLSGRVYILNVGAGSWSGVINLNSTIGSSLWSALFHDGTNLWVHDWNNGIMYLVNPNTGSEVDSFSLSGSPLDGAIVNGITEIDGHMWFYGATLGIQIMNKSTRTFTDSIANPLPGNNEFGIASDGEFVWLTQQSDQLIHEFKLPSIRIVTTRVGFRFPHPWEEEWAVKENVKHLEDQLSRWLHRHEVGI